VTFVSGLRVTQSSFAAIFRSNSGIIVAPCQGYADRRS
jgi:hypothetical protein